MEGVKRANQTRLKRLSPSANASDSQGCYHHKARQQRQLWVQACQEPYQTAVDLNMVRKSPNRHTALANQCIRYGNCYPHRLKPWSAKRKNLITTQHRHACQSRCTPPTVWRTLETERLRGCDCLHRVSWASLHLASMTETTPRQYTARYSPIPHLQAVRTSRGHRQALKWRGRSRECVDICLCRE